jgi:hypothetical protein
MDSFWLSKLSNVAYHKELATNAEGMGPADHPVPVEQLFEEGVRLSSRTWFAP